jgi:hypothetical protein
MLVDENQDRKSVFSLMDYRHNLRTIEECNYHSSNISCQPKEFITWKDSTGEYNPKLAKDTFAGKMIRDKKLKPIN